VALAMRESGQAANDLLDRLAADDRLPMDRAALDALLADRLSFTGDAARQVGSLVAQVQAVAAKHPEAAAYRPGAIL
jgi:adenylosuccinate lyase